MRHLGNKQELLWVYPKENSEWHKTIIKEFNIHPVTAQILVSRGFQTLEQIHDFLYAKLPNLLDPELFNDMDKAVERIMTALNKNEGILIYGDNDVDGMSATALLTEFFRQIGGNVSFFIPNSTIQKKNIFNEALEFATTNHQSLLITVDCGITAAKEIQQTIHKNIDIIITDHHEPTSKIPHCIATLNPKLENSTYPNRDITGVGVAFKLAHAILNFLIENEDPRCKSIDLKQYLDLVALGTIADMGALMGENRILVRYGLAQLRKTKRIGLIKLFHVCDMNLTKITPIDIASKVAPRLNSLGRIADPQKGVELLLIRDDVAAGKLAQELDLYNIERQRIERSTSESIEIYLQTHPKVLAEKAIFLYSNKWHPGIIPIITAKISKQYNRPTILIAIEDNIGKGSIRTIPEFPLLPLLKETEHLLLNFGGHNFAAGLTIEEKQIPIFKKKFIQFVNQALKDKDVMSKLYIDAYIAFKDITFDFMESLSLLEPFGNENPAPILYTDAEQMWLPKVINKAHLKVYLDQDGRMLEGIGFGMADRRGVLQKKNLSLRIAFTPQVNSFLNKSSIQLQLRDFQIKSQDSGIGGSEQHPPLQQEETSSD